MGFWKSTGYTLLLIIGSLMVAFDYFLVTPMKASTAVLQLEDSAALYAIGQKAATSEVSMLIFLFGLALVVISVYKLFIQKLISNKGNTNETDS